MSKRRIKRGGARGRGDVESRTVVPRRARAGQFGVGLAGLTALLVSAWGGIAPYVGPLFGYSGDGTGAWQWNLAHTVLALAPGAAGVLLGLVVLAEVRGIPLGRSRLSLAAGGMLLMVVGAWFAIGPLAWPVLSNGSASFVAGSHLRLLADEIGYSIGTGIVLLVCGAFIDGWASRHRPMRTVIGRPAAAHAGSVERGTGAVESGI
jgi:hypothetical protein